MRSLASLLVLADGTANGEPELVVPLLVVQVRLRAAARLAFPCFYSASVSHHPFVLDIEIDIRRTVSLRPSQEESSCSETDFTSLPARMSTQGALSLRTLRMTWVLS